jgi:hypothetical protein
LQRPAQFRQQQRAKMQLLNEFALSDESVDVRDDALMSTIRLPFSLTSWIKRAVTV